MASAPRTVTEVRLGFRGVQVQQYVRERLKRGEPFPSLSELQRALDFYDKAGASRALRRAGLTTTP